MFPAPDLDFIRNQFPAFSEPSLQGQAHFENAGGSYVCGQVIQRLQQYYCQTKVQPYGLYEASRLAGEQMDQAYQRLAAYLNVAVNEVHIGPSTSQNTVMLAQAFRKRLQAGDEIIVTNQDHEANIGAWRALAAEGMVIRQWEVDPDSGLLDPAQLDQLITEKTRVLAFTHCSNIVAHINPVAEICAKARAADIVTVVDGVSFAGHGLPDVAALGADIYLFSLYKIYGPHQGVMTIRASLAQWLGNQGHFFNENAVHKRFNPAGPDHAQIAATHGVTEYFDTLHQHHFAETDITQATRARQVRELLHHAEKPLLDQLLGYLSGRSDIRILGSADSAQRAPTVAFVSRRQSARAIVEALCSYGIMAGYGHFYAYRLIQALQEDPEQGVVRLSFVHYTSAAEMQQLLKALDAVL